MEKVSVAEIVRLNTEATGGDVAKLVKLSKRVYPKLDELTIKRRVWAAQSDMRKRARKKKAPKSSKVGVAPKNSDLSRAKGESVDGLNGTAKPSGPATTPAPAPRSWLEQAEGVSGVAPNGAENPAASSFSCGGPTQRRRKACSDPGSRR